MKDKDFKNVAYVMDNRVLVAMAMAILALIIAVTALVLQIK